MARFVAEPLDLSRLPAPAVVRNISYETILAARLISLQGRFTAVGVEYDVSMLETDPAVILQQEDAYRETLDLAAINDAAKAVMLPYALGADLDVIASLFGCYRMPNEDDARYRTRVALAPEAYATAGSAGGYIYHAMAVDIAVRHVYADCPSPGLARIVVLGTADGAATPSALVARVQSRLSADDIRPLTDQVVTLGAQIVPYQMSVRLIVPDGPDPSIVRDAARAGLQNLAAARYRVNAGVDLSAIVGAAYAPNIQKIVVTSPAADIPASPLAAPWCTAITVETEAANV